MCAASQQPRIPRELVCSSQLTAHFYGWRLKDSLYTLNQSMATKLSLEELFKNALTENADLASLGQNAFMFFVLALYVQAEDLRALAAGSLTDGGDDKKVDACHIDLDEGRAVIVQGYCAKDWKRAAAPSNKAADLNTAVTWLLSVPLAEVPEKLREKARELRDAITGGDISRLDVLYIHNLPESANVEQELLGVGTNVKKALASMGRGEITVVHQELGASRAEALYASREREILVEDAITVKGRRLGEEEGDGWKAVVMTVEGAWLRELYTGFQESLFSANYRNFLGVSKRRGNINSGIQQTAASEPRNFWVYNNGVTILTNRLEPKPDGTTIIYGCSIINGAQTTGALSTEATPDLRDVRVPCRIVQCSKQELIHQIIKFNNTQNVIRPADIRSSDPVQKRLAKDLLAFGFTYVHRRSAARTPKDALSAESLGPALAAFHGDPQLAGRQRSDIFLNDATYKKIFEDRLSAEHAYLIFSLSMALDQIKLGLNQKVSSGTATKQELAQYDILRYSMSKVFVLYVIGIVAEQIYGGAIADRMMWRCKAQMIKPESKDIVDCWQKALTSVLSLLPTAISQAGKTPYEFARSQDVAARAAATVAGLLDATKDQIEPQFKPLRDATALASPVPATATTPAPVVTAKPVKTGKP